MDEGEKIASIKQEGYVVKTSVGAIVSYLYEGFSFRLFFFPRSSHIS